MCVLLRVMLRACVQLVVTLLRPHYHRERTFKVSVLLAAAPLQP
jgi:hypothetical protein